MILGLGMDLCKIARIEAVLGKFGERFYKRICSAEEYMRAERSRTPHNRFRRYAQYFSAKEACAKALGTGLSKGVFWRDMEVLSAPSGKPLLRLHGIALKRMHALAPEGMKTVPEISLTDEAGLAQAIVVLYAVPEKETRWPRFD